MDYPAMTDEQREVALRTIRESVKGWQFSRVEHGKENLLTIVDHAHVIGNLEMIECLFGLPQKLDIVRLLRDRHNLEVPDMTLGPEYWAEVSRADKQHGGGQEGAGSRD